MVSLYYYHGRINLRKEGVIMVIDCHTHIIFDPSTDIFLKIPELIESMERTRVDKACVIYSPARAQHLYYHMYELSEDVLEVLVDYTQKHNLLISIQMRVEDARGQYPLMKVPDMDIDEVIKILSSFPEQKFIMNNGNLSEVEQALYFADNIYVDISSVESQDVVTYLGGKYGLDRILFSTHSAFFYPEGNVFKLAYSGLGREGLDKVAYGNAEKLGL